MAASTDLERLVAQISADIRSFDRQMGRAVGIMNRQAGEIERRGAQMASRLDSIGKQAANAFLAPLSGIGAALSVREIAAYADAWTEAGNKVRAAATSAGVQARSLDALKDGANAARTDLESYVDLYARLIRSASGVAKSEQEIAAATQIVAQAFKAGGASASEQAAGILQLGQALGSGVLQGDELRSLRENAPILAQAIADEFKTTIAGLKDLGAEGKLTSDRVFQAILNAQPKVAAQFGATNATIKDAITTVNNEFTAYIGNADMAAGASRGLVSALLLLAANFGTVADGAVSLATIIAGALSGRALAGLVISAGNAVVALGALLTALRTGTAVGAAFTASLGPIGILLGTVSAGLLLLSMRQDQADEAAERHKNAVSELTDAFAASQRGADGAKAKFEALAKAHLASATAAVENAEAQLKAAQAVRDAAQSTPMFGEAAAFAATNEDFANKQIDAALAEIAKRKAELADLQKRLANPEAGLAATSDGYGKGPGVTSDTTKVGRRTASDRLREDIQAVQDRTAALAAEQQMIGQSIAAQEARRMAIDLEQRALADLREEARRKGETDLESIQLAPDQIAAIEDVSAAYGRQVEALEKAQQAFDDANDLARGFADDLASGLLNGASAAESLANALDNVADKLLDMALNALFDPAGGGFLAKLFGGMAQGGPVSGGIGRAATGGRIRGPGTGTSDSIPMMLSDGEYVVRAAQAKKFAPLLEAINSGRIGKMAAGGLVGSAPRIPSLAGMGRGGDRLSLSMPISINAPGADGPELARLRAEVVQLKREIPGLAVKGIRNARMRNVRV
ncbi:tape measure protein [Ancylobacter polymorphus]|uniref:Tape measure protein n=1 Tax=Ancylobacter polymorphus TaxID=223390 RepID=A0A9E7CVY2_9HYPH|nr:tape measure protein [Ancylobacter polymorphus]UOK70194.1 tape measure protein [Ancylobacter polymorphus]